MFISPFLDCQSVVKGVYFTYDASSHSLFKVVVRPQVAQTQNITPVGQGLLSIKAGFRACRAICVAWLMALNPAGALAAEPDRLFSDALRKAVLDNPRVATEWYRFEASIAAERAAKGAMLPDINLAADAAREERQTPQTLFEP